MSLMRAIETGDASLLPGRRDEGWRWSDLKGVVPAMQPASPEAAKPQTPPPLADLATDSEIVVVNGRANTFGFHAVAGAPRTLRLRVVSRADHTAHQGVLTFDIEPEAELTLIETYEGDGSGYLSDFSLAISIGEGYLRFRQLHLVAAQILIVEPFKPPPEFLRTGFGHAGSQLRNADDILAHVDRTVGAEG